MDYLSKVRLIFPIVLGTAILLSIGGCTPLAPPPVSIAHALAGISDDLGKFHTLGMIDATLWTSEQQEVFKNAIKAEQCRQKTSDPMIVMLRDNLLIKLTGGFTATGSFSVGSAGMGLPSLSMGGTKSRDAIQELDIPVYMTSLSLLPDYIYLQQKDRYKDIWEEKDVSRSTTYGAAMKQSHALLLSLVEDLMVTYPYNSCVKAARTPDTVLFGRRANP